MKYIKILLLTFFLFPLSVVASNEGAKIKCPTNIKKGEVLIAKIKEVRKLILHII